MLDIVVETLSSRREVDLNEGGVVAPALTREEGALCMCCMFGVLSSQRDMALFTTFFLPMFAEGAVAESSLKEVVLEGAARREAAPAFLRWLVSLVPVARPNHLAPRCWTK